MKCGQHFFTENNGSGDDTLFWDVGFPLREIIDKHFVKEKLHEKVKELGLERELQNSLADCIRMTFILRVIGRMFGDIEKENKAFVGEITELKKLITSLKDERDKLKKTLEESIVEKSQLVAREKNLIEENSKCNVKVLIKEDAHKVTVDKLKAEIEKLKGEISLQYKAGYDKAINQVLFFASRLKP
jgi:predicted RNase H-like nuclease (RuvC/YqgF family)